MYFRPAEVELLHGLPKKAEALLGWKRTVAFDSLVREMVEADLVGVGQPSVNRLLKINFVTHLSPICNL